MKNKNKNQKTAIGAAVGILLMVFAYNIVPYLKRGSASFDKVMMEVASEINASCPIMVDRETQLDNAIALPDNVFQYNYTLINVSEEEVHTDTIRKYIEPGIINTARTNPDMKVFRQNKVTLNYNYQDKNGVFLLKISVTPELYLD